jgi:hypothetical protein
MKVKVQRGGFCGECFWFLVPGSGFRPRLRRGLHFVPSSGFRVPGLNAFFNAAALKKGFINTSANQHIKHNLSAAAESV